jgi:hypothetical protein
VTSDRRGSSTAVVKARCLRGRSEIAPAKPHAFAPIKQAA